MTVPTTETGYYYNLTDEQIDALKAVVEKLPIQLAENKLSGEDLSLWGTTLDGLNPHTELTKHQKIVLLKFLRAREFQVDKSIKMIVDTLKWRKDFNMTTLTSETFPKEVSELGTVHGFDKQGCPVTYNFYGGMSEDLVLTPEKGVETFIRWRVQLMEKAIAKLDWEKDIETITQIHDYMGASFFPSSKMRAVTKQIIDIFQNYYPEFLSQKLFVNVSGFLSTLYSLISTFVNRKTKSKFSMIAAGKTREALLEIIEIQQLPSRYGGFVEYTSTSAEQGQTGLEEIMIPSRQTKFASAYLAANQSLEWQFLTAASDVAFSVEFTPTGENAEIAVAAKKLNEGTGMYKATKEGVVKLVFENKSLMGEKKVVYRVRTI